jgi:hypothetical protein
LIDAEYIRKNRKIYILKHFTWFNTAARWTVSDSETDEEPVVVTVFQPRHSIEGKLWKKKGHGNGRHQGTDALNVVAETLSTITRQAKPSVATADWLSANRRWTRGRSGELSHRRRRILGAA